ncbi:TIGR04500 family putative peptide maturation system protein [Rhodococcus sp. NPDC003318]|uniref:TIGR04500 family putative peptide maturation system protein n=1 Tax=Rhodococcus sp. NPDC003318 TaxID=3364503 RepID=UPI0036C11ADF
MTPPSLLTDALSVLRDLDPNSADRALDPLRAAHPRSRLRLLRHRESVDDSVHFGMLITEPGVGTTTLSWTPASAVPWSLRGSQRTAESMLLRVNGEPLAIEEAMAHLDVLWERTDLLDRLITVCLVRQELAENPVLLDAGRLQEAMDAFRRARGLLTPEATREWMRERALSHEALEDLVEREAAVAELKQRILAEQRLDPSLLDRARVVRVRFTERTFADSFVTLVRTRPGSDAVGEFAAAAAGAFAVSTAVTGTEFVEVAADSVGRAQPGTVLGPTADPDGWVVTQVLATFPSTPGPRADRQLADIAFDRWVAQRRRDARIEWFWGAADKTPTEPTGTTVSIDGAVPS